MVWSNSEGLGRSGTQSRTPSLERRLYPAVRVQPSPPLPEVQASEPVVIVAQPFPRGGGGRVPTQLKNRGKPTRKRQVETSP